MKIKTEEFIKRAREVHGNKYDYSKAVYTGKENKVIIICPEHGEFKQRAYSHKVGCGCPKCKTKKHIENSKLTIEEFIKRAREVHGDTYTYGSVKYVNQQTKIIITCPKHGDFQQLPTNFIRGYGCPKCSKNVRDTETFINKAKDVHGNRYDYTKVLYKRTDFPVTIICPEHGEFEQLPSVHLSGSKCPKCSHRSYKLTTEEFIKRAHEVHGDKYDYSKVKYVNSQTIVTITCPEHGDFNKLPPDHLKGSGCKICGNLKRKKEKIKKYSKIFIEKANKIHNNFYDYSKIKYINNSTPVKIICPEHGEFMQQPSNHLMGKKCGRCAGTYADIKTFVEKANKIHNNFYDYSKSVYLKNNLPITITCPEHGDFKQLPSVHLMGSSCPKCVGRGLDYLTYGEAKKIVNKLGLKTQREYNKWWEENKKYCQKIGIPGNPQNYYTKNK